MTYKDMSLRIPYKPEEYVTLLYGENWRTPAKKWSYLDYGNLLTKEALERMIKQQ